MGPVELFFLLLTPALYFLYNFADLPLWDIVFGTFRNPAEYPGECGFEGGRDQRIGAMLLFADVNAEPYGVGSRGVRPANPA